MREIPQLYSTPMVHSILENRKTKSRRAQGFGIVNEDPGRYKFHGLNDFGCALFEDLKPEITPWMLPIKCPFGQPGDLIWVREEHYQYGTWLMTPDKTKSGKFKWKFFADRSAKTLFSNSIPATFRISRDKEHPNRDTWYKRLGRFLPKSKARIWLQITDITVERLQSITEEDAIAEGIKMTFIHDDPYQCLYKNYWDDGSGSVIAQDSFASLWKFINGENSWV